MSTEHCDKNRIIQHTNQTTAGNTTPGPPELPQGYTEKHVRIAKIAVSMMLGIPLLATLVTVTILLYNVPSGAERLPFLLASVRLTDIPPSGNHPPIAVFINDVGAAHSGNFWTWVTIPDTLPWRRRVIAQGYSSMLVRYQRQTFPFAWTGRTTFRVEFAQDRYSDKPVVVEGALRDEFENAGK